MFSPELLAELRERAAALRATADGWAEQAADARKAAKDYEEQAMAARRREHELIALASYVEAHRVGDVLVAGVPQNPFKGPAPTTVFPVGEHPYSPQERAPFEAYRPATAEQIETPGVDAYLAETRPAQAQYRVTYERVGRRRDVPPLVVVAAGADDLAERIYDDARPYLMSQDADVAVDLETMTGTIFCGVRNGGQFTIEALGDGPR